MTPTTLLHSMRWLFSMCCRRSLSVGLWFAASITVLGTGGCSDDRDLVRKIQSQRQQRIRSQTKQDHLGEIASLLQRHVELNADQARRQIVYHLNSWMVDKSFDEIEITKMVGTVSEVLSKQQIAERIEPSRFTGTDISHLRDSYLFRKIVQWVDHPQHDDLLLEDWFAKLETEIGQGDADRLRTASRLFDWTVRNIAFEPRQPTDPAPPGPKFSLEMKFRGPGYRQTDFQTVWRSTGDSLQRAGVFTQLCRQAEIPAFVLATQSVESGELDPWCVGVLVGKEIYLFEPELSTHVAVPNQVGIATLAQARKDAVVMRRLSVPGFFDYPLTKKDIQQSVALLNVLPEAISPRMKHLESGLTGERRMTIFVDTDSLAKRIDEVPGIAGVRLWDVPLLAEVYQQELSLAVDRDPALMFWNVSRWAHLESVMGNAKDLALARWRHLHGQFDNDEEEDTKGARVIYLRQRKPEFEIEDLRINVDLQLAYGIRRTLGVEAKNYDFHVQQAQKLMRRGKQTATFWISLIQFNDDRFETAETWLSKRVLEIDRETPWQAAARYNLARTLERLGQVDRAVELYKTEGDPQEHGNRIRARLLLQSQVD